MKIKVKALAMMILAVIMVFAASACKAPELEKIEVISTGHKTSYLRDETLSVTNLKIKATMSDGKTEEVDVDANMISGFNSTKLVSSQTLTITYTLKEVTKTATFNISVNYPAPSGYRAYQTANVSVCYPTAWTTVPDADYDFIAMDVVTESAIMIISDSATLSQAEYDAINEEAVKAVFLSLIAGELNITDATFSKVKKDGRNAFLLNIEGIAEDEEGAPQDTIMKAYIVFLENKMVMIIYGGLKDSGTAEMDTIFENTVIK